MTRSRRVTGLLIVLLIATTVVVATTSASAEVVSVPAGTKVFATAQPFTLASLKFQARTSWNYYITGKLVFGGETARVLVGTRIDCDGTRLHPLSFTATNGLPEDPVRTTYTRALWNPLAGTPTCVFSITSFVKGIRPTDPTQFFTVQPGSYLEVTPVSNDAATVGQPEEVFLPNGRAYDAAVLRYVAPSTATLVHAVSDINVTNCEPHDLSKICRGGVDNRSSTLTYSMVVAQWNTDRTGYCAISRTDDRHLLPLASPEAVVREPGPDLRVSVVRRSAPLQDQDVRDVGVRRRHRRPPFPVRRIHCHSPPDQLIWHRHPAPDRAGKQARDRLSRAGRSR
jgi:hypothetical protein